MKTIEEIDERINVLKEVKNGLIKVSDTSFSAHVVLVVEITHIDGAIKILEWVKE
jgi:hypothetical protein